MPNANSQVTFKTRAHFVLAADHPVVAVAEVSPDDGVTWQAVYVERATSDTAFNDRAVPLGQFAGQHVQLRFRLDNVNGWGSDGTEGWYVDDVTLNNVLGADPPTLSEVSPATTFAFTPTEAAQYDIGVRPQFSGSGFADWSPPTRVSIAAPGRRAGHHRPAPERDRRRRRGRIVHRGRIGHCAIGLRVEP